MARNMSPQSVFIIERYGWTPDGEIHSIVAIGGPMQFNDMPARRAFNFVDIPTALISCARAGHFIKERVDQLRTKRSAIAFNSYAHAQRSQHGCSLCRNGENR
jgi:hypothetical protein